MYNIRLAGGHLYGKELFTWLSLVVSLMASFVLSFFPLDVLDEIWDLIETVSKGFLTYSYRCVITVIIPSHVWNYLTGVFSRVKISFPYSVSRVKISTHVELTLQACFKVELSIHFKIILQVFFKGENICAVWNYFTGVFQGCKCLHKCLHNLKLIYRWVSRVNVSTHV